MRKRISLFLFIVMWSLGVCVNAWAAPFAYITNYSSNTVSIIDTAINAVIGSPIPVGTGPCGVAVNPAGTRVYVTNDGSWNVSVIDTATNTVIGSTISVGTNPWGVAVNPTGTRVYVANFGSNTVSVIDTATNMVIGSPIPVGTKPSGVVINPAGTWVYVANFGSNTVSVIDTATNTVIGSPIPVGINPFGVAVNPAGTRVYVANYGSGDLSVIDTATNTVIGSPSLGGTNPVGVAVNPAGTMVYVAQAASNWVSVIDTVSNTVIGSPIPVGVGPEAFGQFIIPPQAYTIWEGTVSFSAKITSVETDASENRKLLTSNQPFAGTISLFIGDNGLTINTDGCYLRFWGDDGTSICIKEIGGLATESQKSKNEKVFLVGLGDFTSTIEGNQVTGIAYIDLKGTLKQDSSNNLVSIVLNGKVGGGGNDFVFSGNLSNTNLTKQAGTSF